MTEKTAVVTGASKGIGFEIAKVLLKNGYKVYGLARSESSLGDLEKMRRRGQRKRT